MSSRRKFIQQLSAASLVAPLSSLAKVSEEEVEKRMIPYERKVTVNDKMSMIK